MNPQSSHLDPVVALLVYDRYVAPVHLPDYIDHRLHLVMIAGYSSCEILESLFVGKFWARRKKRNLQKTKKEKKTTSN